MPVTESQTHERQAPLARIDAPTSVLETHGLWRRFGGLVALQDVSISIAPGEIIGILGPNGAGKSTFINVASGAIPASAGSVLIAGEEIGHLGLAARARKGLARTFQNTRPSEELTPREILRLAHLAPGRGRDGVDYHPNELIEIFELGDFADIPHAALPYGFQKIVLLAATTLCRPRVLLLDEPFQGVSDSELERIAAVIRRFQAAGVAIGLVEHNVKSVMALCERIVVLDAGRMIFSGAARDALRDEAVQTAYLGARMAKAHG